MFMFKKGFYFLPVQQELHWFLKRGRWEMILVGILFLHYHSLFSHWWPCLEGVTKTSSGVTKKISMRINPAPCKAQSSFLHKYAISVTFFFHTITFYVISLCDRFSLLSVGTRRHRWGWPARTHGENRSSDYIHIFHLAWRDLGRRGGHSNHLVILLSPWL